MHREDSHELRTRQRLLEAAVPLLARQGLAGGVLERAAAEAGCPSERARIYFRRDEDLVLALYLRLAAELEERVAEFPEGSVATRFRAAMLAKLDLVAPYRDALAAFLSAALDPRHELGALSPHTELVRSRVGGVFAAVVLGAKDRPKPPADAALARALYGAHLAVLLLWTQDRSDGQTAARAAVDLAGDLVSKALLLARLRGSLTKLDGVVAPLVEPPPDPDVTALAERVLRVVFDHRRLQPGARACAASPCAECFALHTPRVRRSVLLGEPIHLLLPAFPAKSPNPRKVLGKLPDMAEEIAVAYLQGICDRIAVVYPPGATITICSDGHVFSDLVGVADDDVTRYGAGIVSLIDRLGARSLDLFDMGDLFETSSFEAMRGELSAHYAEPLEALEQRTRVHEHHRELFNGIHRFVFEDRAALEPDKSRNRVREESKRLAYEVIRRSNAWGRLVAECFPTALRLSIHPQHPHSEKIGILLADDGDVWLTPWHGVAVRERGRSRLLHRHQAEALGARLVERDGRPSHFELE
jgi:pyoverdine/dityrosine biosynthesis protein Dit1/AcrR family transcriptional regulator